MERVVPALVGRAEALAFALRRWESASTGTGHFLLVAGEAGIGKTRLLGEISARVPDAFQFGATVYPRDVEAVGAVIFEICAAIARTRDVGTAEALRERLTAEPDAGGDKSRNRRMLAADLASIITDLLAAQPTLLRIEDVHWADELSLDVIERVAATLADTSSMVMATYRSDELYPRSPLRRVRARLLEQRLAEEIRLPRLDAEQTADLIRSISESELSGDIARGIYDRSDGIPLYIEELFAHSGTTVPDTIADAVAVRVAGLRPATIPVLEAAAVIGRSFDTDLLEAVARAPRDEIDDALLELGEHNLILAGSDGPVLDFRHALIRDAVYERIPPLRKRDIHSAVADAAVAAQFSDSFLSDQYERARKPALAYAHALAAAREAMALASHREAVELLRRAQRTAPGSVTDLERAVLDADLAEVLAATDDNEGAAVQLETAMAIYRVAGDEIAVARLLPSLVAVQNLLGQGFDARARLLEDAVRTMDEAVPPDVRAALYSALATALMLDRCLDDAIEAGTRAAELADASGSASERIDIDLTLGAVLVFAGPGRGGWPLLESATARAREHRFEAQAARGYRMMGSCASVLVEYPKARQWISEGLEYARTAERWNDLHYLEAHDAHVKWATGDWDTAQTIAARALADGRGGITTRNTALLVLGYLELGRGNFIAARKHLTDARAIGETMHELQRLVPALWGLSELELLEGNPQAAIDLAESAYALSEPIGDAAYVFPLVTSGVRAYLARRDTTGARDWFERTAYLLRYRGIPGTLPAIAHADGLLLLAEGKTGAARALLEQATTGWDDRGRTWDSIRARIDLAHCLFRSRLPRDASRLLADARELASTCGATALLDLAGDHAGQEGTGPLSERELEVARLVSMGATNREIAERLVISPKTASSHIEHILAKLGVSRRSEIAAWITRVPG